MNIEVGDAIGQWLTGAVAIYGAALSTYNLSAQRRRDRRSLKVRVEWVMATSDHGILVPARVILRASNTGHRPISIAGLTLIVCNERRIDVPDLDATPAIPCKLAEGEALTIHYPVAQAARLMTRAGYFGTVTLIAEFVDAIGAKYRSDDFELNLALAPKN